jgi:diacylglycerol kinase (ATP)
MQRLPTFSKSFFRERLHSFRYAFQGLLTMFLTASNFWIHITITVLVVAAGFWLHISLTEWFIVILTIGLVLSAETFNTAIEQLTDLVQPERNPQAGRIKDLAAGAVLLTAIAAAIIGLLIFVPKIIEAL